VTIHIKRPARTFGVIVVAALLVASGVIVGSLNGGAPTGYADDPTPTSTFAATSTPNATATDVSGDPPRMSSTATLLPSTPVIIKTPNVTAVPSPTP
jgi:hypothetical protein